MNVKRLAVRALVPLAATAVVIQAVPYGRDHANPPVTGEPAWDSPRTRELAQRACFDCHSNETRWPFYTHVAPFSWLVQHDVEEGRAVLNVSEWARPQEEAAESAESVLSGEMPLAPYLWLHPSARLNTEERDALVRGLAATFGSEGQREQGERDEEHEARRAPNAAHAGAGSAF